MFLSFVVGLFYEGGSRSFYEVGVGRELESHLCYTARKALAAKRNGLSDKQTSKSPKEALSLSFLGFGYTKRIRRTIFVLFIYLSS